MKAKMRIKTLDNNLVTISDRLVDQDTEFNLGPKDKHTGPIQVEVVLRDKSDVERFNKYLSQLTGQLPIPERKVYAKKAGADTEDLAPIEDMLKEVLKCKTQDEVITYLRDRNFKFVTAEFIKAKELKIDLLPEQEAEYQFMVRLLKEGKDPKVDKYDPQLAIGIKFIGKKGKFIQVYLYGKHEKKVQMPWAEKSAINFKKVAAMRFPHYMIQDERDKYSLEVRKLKLNPELKPSKFFLRWKPAVDAENKNI